MDERKKQALERAYARFLEEQAKKEAAAKEAAAVEAVSDSDDVVIEADEMNLSTFEILNAINEEETKEVVAVAPVEETEQVSTAVVEVKETAVEEKTAEKKELAESKKKAAPILAPKELVNDVALTVEAIGDVLAAMIDVHDRWQAKSDLVLIDMGKSLVAEYHNMITRYRLSRKRIGSSVLYMTLISCAMLLVFNHFTVYEYAYNGRVLGYVDDQTKVTDVLDVASTQLSKNNGVPIEFKGNDNITFNQVSSVDKTLDDSDAVVNKLAYMTDIEVNAYGIYEGGELRTIVESEAAAERTINATMAIQSKPDEGMKVISSKFQKKITTEPITVLISSVQTQSAAQIMTTKGGSFDIYHIVDNGETLNSIASTFSVEKSQILNSDTGKSVGSVDAGDKILIKKVVSPIKVEMLEDGTMSEIVHYKVITKNTKKLYKGDKAVKQKGRDGKQIITGKVTKVNGEITKRNLTNTEVIRPVQDKIILIGTAKRPKTAPTGVFGMPIRNYVLTSRVGARWGKIHEGLDFGAPTGTPIYASDGGTVTISGVQSGYGNVIYISHGNGYETRYGHCSQLLVPAGAKVYKGQQIALVGSTGFSTGPHLHFEIRKNGVYQDSGHVLGLY